MSFPIENRVLGDDKFDAHHVIVNEYSCGQAGEIIRHRVRGRLITVEFKPTGQRREWNYAYDLSETTGSRFRAFRVRFARAVARGWNVLCRKIHRIQQVHTTH